MKRGLKDIIITIDINCLLLKTFVNVDSNANKISNGRTLLQIKNSTSLKIIVSQENKELGYCPIHWLVYEKEPSTTMYCMYA